MKSDQEWEWTDPHPSKEARASIEQWQIVETTTGQRCVIGYRLDRGLWVSPAIDGIDRVSRRVRALSGHIFQLIGPPGIDAEMEALWPKVVEARGIEGWFDVSSKV